MPFSYRFCDPGPARSSKETSKARPVPADTVRVVFFAMLFKVVVFSKAHDEHTDSGGTKEPTSNRRFSFVPPDTTRELSVK